MASPYNDAALVSGGFDDALFLFGYDPAAQPALSARGELAYNGTAPELPFAAALIDRGELTGLVLVAENQGIRRLRFAPGGTVVDLGDRLYLDVCPGSCWPGLSYWDDSLPPEAPYLVGRVIDVYGELFMGMEGPYIHVTDWGFSPIGCGPVATTTQSWGALKSGYR